MKAKDIMVNEEFLNDIYNALPDEFTFDELTDGIINSTDFRCKLAWYLSSRLTQKKLSNRIDIIDHTGHSIASYDSLDEVPNKIRVGKRGIFPKNLRVAPNNIEIVFVKSKDVV